MKRKAMISLLLILIVMLSVSGCGKKQKRTVLTNDVKKQEDMKENKVKKIIKDGIKFLNAGKYDDAKSSFEKAVSMDKANKASYIEIKNKYMEKNRVDDAYYFIKLAISNKVDIKNMKDLLNTIKSKFEVTKVYAKVYQDNEYNLPSKIKAKINNKDKEVAVSWDNNNVDTSSLGTKKYIGRIEQYDRTAELNLTVIKKSEKASFKNNKVNSNKDKVLQNSKNNNKVVSNKDKVLEHDKNNKVEFSRDKALEYAKNYYDNNEDLTYSIIQEVENQNGEKCYEIVVKSKTFIKQGGTGTVGVIKVFEDGKIVE
ncbi:Ig-like domain-containing protein [Clostridium oceanicum]|uniref:Ig-like domain-containing protein n=1 Tax=Clostridium oceanicum TaxID=1543 RepID=A0ABN1JFD2_9CLOT